MFDDESFTAWLDRQTVDRLEPSWDFQQERAMSDYVWAMDDRIADAEAPE